MRLVLLVMSLLLVPAHAYAGPVIAAVAAYASTISITSILVNAAISIGVSFVLGAVFKKPKAPSFGGSGSTVARDRTITVREPTSPWKIRTGWSVMGGSITHLDTSGSSNEYFHLVITIAPHQMAWLGDIRFDGVRVPIDSNGDVVSGNYVGYVFVEKNLGTPDQAPFPDLLSKSDKWTIRHRQNGRACIHVRLKYDESRFPNGVPNITIEGAGAFVYDSRDTGATITTSAATNGLDTGSLQAFTAAVSDVCTATAHGYATGDGPVRLTTTDTLPSPLSTSTSYYAIRVDADTLKWATSVVNAEAGTAVDITDAGTGTHKVGDYLPLALITTSGAHGLTAGDRAYIRSHAGSSPELYGDYYVWSVPTSDTAEIFLGYNTTLDTVGTGGTIIKMVFSDNPCLWQATYLTNRSFGLSAVFDDEIDETDLEESANAADEEVSVAQTSTTFTADADTDEMTQDDTSGIALCLGEKVTLSTTDTLPAGLSPGDYYVHPTDTYTFKVATTRDNALNQVYVDITDAGTGTHTITRIAEPRYTANGSADVSEEPYQILGYINSAMSGRTPYIGGKFHITSGFYRTPTITFDEGDLRSGSFNVLGLVGAEEAFNAVKGVYLSPANAWQPADFPAVTNATYEAQDGGRKWRDDFDLNYTISGTMAQRLASIDLNKARQEITVQKAPYKLSASRIKAIDVANLTIDHMGWSAKPFEATETVWTLSEDSEGNPFLGLDISWRETSSTVWDWSTASEITIDPAPNTNLPSVSTVAAPTGLTLTAGTADLFKGKDGTIHSRIHATWTAPLDIFATRIEVQWKKTTDTEYESTYVSADTVEVYLAPVVDEVIYNVRIRTIGAFPNITSAWVADTVTVEGKSADPSDVTGFVVAQSGASTTFRWNQVSDIDLAGYEIRYFAQGSFTWDVASVLTSVTKGTLVTNNALPPGAWTVGIKARDTSENYSTNATTFDITVSNENTVIDSFEISGSWVTPPDMLLTHWTGTLVQSSRFAASELTNAELFTQLTPYPKGVKLTNFVEHWTGKLVPSSTLGASSLTNAELFTQFVPYPQSDGYVEGPMIDADFDSSDMRLWSEIDSELGPGKTGTADPQLQVTLKQESGTWGAFQNHTLGYLAETRYVKTRVHLDTSVGVAVISRFKCVLDAEIDVQSAQSVSVGSGGESIVFTERFHTVPIVKPTATSAAQHVAIPTSVTALGFDVDIYDITSGLQVAGTTDWEARGV